MCIYPVYNSISHFDSKIYIERRKTGGGGGGGGGLVRKVHQEEREQLASGHSTQNISLSTLDF